MIKSPSLMNLTPQKTYSLIFFFMLAAVSWSQQEKDSIREISYSARSRGLFKVVLVDKNNVIVQTNDGVGSFETDESYWKKVYQLCSAISLPDIKNLQAPTNERARDAAFASKIEIHTDYRIYVSSEFDEGHPPSEIRTLVTLLEAQLLSK